MRHAPLTADLRDQLRSMVTTHGEVRAAAALGISRHALVRGIAGLPLAPGTHALLRERLGTGRTDPEAA